MKELKKSKNSLHGIFVNPLFFPEKATAFSLKKYVASINIMWARSQEWRIAGNFMCQKINRFGNSS